jgi:hypothetical protein
MSTTSQARALYSNRRLAAKWVLARRYLSVRGIHPYQHLPMALRIVTLPA